MIEKAFIFNSGSSKTIERIVEDEHAAINHIVLGQFDALPEHNANSNVYMIIIRGNISLRLDDQSPRVYPAGNIIAIPYRTHMRIANESTDILEFFVVKAPSPAAQLS